VHKMIESPGAGVAARAKAERQSYLGRVYALLHFPLQGILQAMQPLHNTRVILTEKSRMQARESIAGRLFLTSKQVAEMTTADSIDTARKQQANEKRKNSVVLKVAASALSTNARCRSSQPYLFNTRREDCAIEKTPIFGFPGRVLPCPLVARTKAPINLRGRLACPPWSRSKLF
jgi:hypothetical protein